MPLDGLSSVWLLSAGPHRDAARESESSDANAWLQLFLWGAITMACAALIAAGAMILHGRVSQRRVDLLRYAGFASLHCADYATNVIVMVIMAVKGHPGYFAALLSVHSVISTLCLYTAVHETNWRKWDYPFPVNFVFTFLILGLMQGVQVKFARDDYLQQVAVRQGGEVSESAMRSMMPARYNCKTLDGIIEGTVFTFVVMYEVLYRNWTDKLRDWQALVLYASALLSLLTVGLAMMELDHRTSSAVQRQLDRSSFAQVRHLFFRSSEVATRLMTILMFTCFSQETAYPWVSYVFMGADYLVGLVLISTLGGRDHFRAMLTLGFPLLVVNVMQFVDAPGVSLQARRISRLVVPVRSAQAVGVLVFCYLVTGHIQPVNPGISADSDVPTWLFVWRERTPVLAFWILSGIVYHVLLVIYAYQLKPGADLHSAVAYAEVESLRQLLRDSELVLDINRYGPDGRTPLHLATIKGNVECMRLLLEEGASLTTRTGNKMRNTALHLAAANREPAAAQFLCAACHGDAAILNAKNADGNTAVHIAALKQNVGALQELLRVPGVDFKMKNAKGQTPENCAHSKFGFDRNSPESAIAELLALAQSGTLRGSPGRSEENAGMELAEMRGSPPTQAQGSGETVSRRSPEGVEAPSSSGPASQENLNFGATKHSVPLNTIDTAQEEAFLRRSSTSGQLGGRSVRDPVLMSKCGISSFMLSAGLGAMSRSIASPIPEDGEFQEEGAGHKAASFEDFEDIMPLGEGVFGKVVKVRHKATGEIFAMKLMNKAKFKAQKITSTAHSEQFILKTTRHPFVVTLHYAFQGSSFWALVMEFCPYGDLQNQLGKYGTPGMNLELAARFAGESLLALEHLHSINVIFRDLKLENVIVDKHYRARVTDFGLAKKLNGPGDAKTMCGSYGYAAPEIMMNVGRYTYAVDLYSFGVMLYMLVSGGEISPKNKDQRMPPLKHSGLRKKLDLAGKEPHSWARYEGAHSLCDRLTHDEPRKRPTASEVKHDTFFAHALRRSVDNLLHEGPFRPEDEPDVREP